MAQPGEPAGNLREIMPLEIAREKLADGLSGPAWRLNVSGLELTEGASSGEPSLVSRIFGYSKGNKNRIAKYYKKQEKILKDFIEMESLTELGYIKGAPTKVELAQVARNERMAINISNIANLVIFIAKLYLSISSRSLGVIASTLDSLLDLLSGFILWFTSNAMKKPDQYLYPIGKMRMQPVGIVVFASAMATFGVQILLESGQQLLSSSHSSLNLSDLNLIIGVMSSVTVVKFVLMIYCQSFKNEIVKAYAQDHFFDVITNSVGLATAILAISVSWLIDPVGAILIALYTMGNWAKTVLENVRSLVGKSAPPDYLTKLTYLIWNHHEEIKHINTVRAYTFGFYYFVEVDIVLPGNMLLCESHDIGETLQMKLEQLPEVERAFVHVDFEFTHKPEHKATIG